MDRRPSSGGGLPVWVPSTFFPSEGQTCPTSPSLIPLKLRSSCLWCSFSLGWAGHLCGNFSCISWALFTNVHLRIHLQRVWRTGGKAPPSPSVLCSLCSSYCVCIPMGGRSALTESNLMKSKPETTTGISDVGPARRELPYRRRKMTQTPGLSL